MKKLIMYAMLAITFGCESKKYKYDIEVTYTNGEKDTVSVTTNEFKGKQLFMDSGCIYKVYVSSRYEANFQGCVVCGVRKYKFL